MSHFAQRAMLLAQNTAKQAANLAANPSPSIAAPSDDADEFKWIGLAIVVGSAILSNLGVNVQKLSHVKEEKRSLFLRRPYYVRPLWIIGMTFVVLGSIGDFEALAFAPQALVASVGGGCTVLANMGFAHLWLGQRLTWYDVFGTFFILVGVVLSTLANTPDAQLDLNELELHFRHLEFLVYFSVMVCRVLLGPASSTVAIFYGMVATLVLQTDLLNRAIMSGDTLSVFPVFQCFWIGVLGNDDVAYTASVAATGRFGSLMPLSPPPLSSALRTPIFRHGSFRSNDSYGSVKAKETTSAKAPPAEI
ncbi:hypothetical protein DYB28_000910 [Aphanomyces astaci]|uniref:Uncharacterized protein n=1 Tax=Aphanomyces astaci TaxID=112090 RepID=A0A9X8DM64_APHAT|nr:hypothetical protein DYB28_000910 [Aphanomyces astaci]